MLVLNREDPQLKMTNGAHFAACSQAGMQAVMSILKEIFSAFEEYLCSARHSDAFPVNS